MRTRWHLRLLVAAATVAGSLAVAPSASAATCSLAGPYYSTGVNGNTGTLATCNVPATSAGLRSASYQFCYLANTNGAPASIITMGVLPSGVSVPLDTHTFTTPHNGNGQVTCSNWSGYGYSIPIAAFTQIRWDYVNGDWRVGIQNIYVS